MLPGQRARSLTRTASRRGDPRRGHRRAVLERGAGRPQHLSAPYKQELARSSRAAPISAKPPPSGTPAIAYREDCSERALWKRLGSASHTKAGATGRGILHPSASRYHSHGMSRSPCRPPIGMPPLTEGFARCLRLATAPATRRVCTSCRTISDAPLEPRVGAGTTYTLR